MKLISFGEIIWDVYPDGATLGGAPLNFAMHSVMRGAEVLMLSAVGDDELGKRALDMIGAAGVNTSAIQVIDGMDTGKCTVTLNDAGVPSYRIDEASAYDKIGVPSFSLSGYNALSFGTLSLRDDYNRKTLELLMKAESFDEIFTDLNVRMPFCSAEAIRFCLSHATAVKISDEELGAVVGLLSLPASDEAGAVKEIFKLYGQISLIIITRGGDGAACYERAGALTECAAYPATVISTVGAGDSFGASFLCEYMESGNVEKALRLAAMVSAYVVSHKEAVPCGVDKIRL